MTSAGSGIRRAKRYWTPAILVGGAMATAAVLFTITRMPRPLFTSAPPDQPVEAEIAAIAEPVLLSASPRVVLVSGQMVSGGTASASPRSLGLKDARFEIDLAARAGAAEQPTGASYLSESQRDRTPVATRSLFSQVTAMGFDRVSLTNATARVRWGDGPGIEISSITLEITPKRTGLTSVGGSYSFAGDTGEFTATIGAWSPVAFERKRFGSWSGLQTQASDAVGPDVAFAIKSPVTNVAFDGQLALMENGLALVGDLETTALDPLSLLRKFGVAAPAGYVRIEPVSLKGPIVWRDRQISSDAATIRVGDQTASGAVLLGWRDDRPLVEGTVALGRLDLAPYISALKPGATSRNDRETWRSIATDVPLLRLLDADIRLSARQLFVGEALIGRGSATVSVRNGKLIADIPDLEVKDAKGTLQINADMTGSPPIYSVRSRFETSNTDWLSRIYSIDGGIRGRTQGALDLTGTGSTISDLTRTARGTVVLSSGEGANLPFVLAALQKRQKQPGGDGAIDLKALAGESRVDKVDARIKIANGRLVVDRASIVDKGMTTSITGVVDSVARSIDARIISVPERVGPSSASGGTDGGRSARAGVVVRGPMDSPKIEALPDETVR